MPRTLAEHPASGYIVSNTDSRDESTDSDKSTKPKRKREPDVMCVGAVPHGHAYGFDKANLLKQLHDEHPTYDEGIAHEFCKGFLHLVEGTNYLRLAYRVAVNDLICYKYGTEDDTQLLQDLLDYDIDNCYGKTTLVQAFKIMFSGQKRSLRARSDYKDIMQRFYDIHVDINGDFYPEHSDLFNLTSKFPFFNTSFFGNLEYEEGCLRVPRRIEQVCFGGGIVLREIWSSEVRDVRKEHPVYETLVRLRYIVQAVLLKMFSVDNTEDPRDWHKSHVLHGGLVAMLHVCEYISSHCLGVLVQQHVNTSVQLISEEGDEAINESWNFHSQGVLKIQSNCAGNPAAGVADFRNENVEIKRNTISNWTHLTGRLARWVQVEEDGKPQLVLLEAPCAKDMLTWMMEFAAKLPLNSDLKCGVFNRIMRIKEKMSVYHLARQEVFLDVYDDNGSRGELPFTQLFYVKKVPFVDETGAILLQNALEGNSDGRPKRLPLANKHIESHTMVVGVQETHWHNCKQGFQIQQDLLQQLPPPAPQSSDSRIQAWFKSEKGLTQAAKKPKSVFFSQQLVPAKEFLLKGGIIDPALKINCPYYYTDLTENLEDLIKELSRVRMTLIFDPQSLDNHWTRFKKILEKVETQPDDYKLPSRKKKKSAVASTTPYGFSSTVASTPPSGFSDLVVEGLSLLCDSASSSSSSSSLNLSLPDP